jgi:hypothetical protein
MAMIHLSTTKISGTVVYDIAPSFPFPAKVSVCLRYSILSLAKVSQTDGTLIKISSTDFYGSCFFPAKASKTKDYNI